MNLNISNVEDLVFYDQNIQKRLPSHRHLFDQWKLGKMAPALKQLGKKALLDFLNDLTPDSLAILEEYFGCDVTITKINYNIVSNCICALDDTDEALQQIEGFIDLAIYRNKEQLYISFWR